MSDYNPELYDLYLRGGYDEVLSFPDFTLFVDAGLIHVLHENTLSLKQYS